MTTCRYCKGTKQIHLLMSTVPCTECKTDVVANRYKPIESVTELQGGLKIGDLLKYSNSGNVYRIDTMDRILTPIIKVTFIGQSVGNATQSVTNQGNLEMDSDKVRIDIDQKKCTVYRLI